ncbi:MAG: helix-turn-helix domain-containing protein [Myxococcota bacterium]
MKADARRSQLVTVGLRLFGSRGYDEVQIDEIAAEAGIAKGLLYHYFGSKRGLYLEVVRAAAAELLAALEPDSQLSGPDNVRRGILAYFGFVEARAGAYLALMRGGLHSDPDVAAVLDGVRQAIVDRIAAGIGMASLPPAFRVAARSWIGAAEAAALDWLDHRDLSASALADLLGAGLFGQLVAASGQAPKAGAKLELSLGLRMLGSLMGSRAEPEPHDLTSAPAASAPDEPKAARARRKR